jgi:hypothetical protein
MVKRDRTFVIVVVLVVLLLAYVGSYAVWSRMNDLPHPAGSNVVWAFYPVRISHSADFE